MLTEQNKALVRQLGEETLNRGNTPLVDDLFATDYVEREELPPGKSMSIRVIDIFRIDEGKFVEHWGLMDNVGLMQLLGAILGPK